VTFEPPRNDPFPALVLMVIRGIALWLLVPIGFFVWILVSPWLVPRAVGLSKFVGWIDLNFAAFLQRVILRPFFATLSLPWVPFRDACNLRHRVSFRFDFL